MAGFGGVAEYGITVRWDKNFLKLIRLLLERRSEFQLFGGVRFGGTLTLDDAFDVGFDHVALCAGAGRPTVLDLPNGLARGVRTASDFLMALQLTGAAKTDSVANLQIRLPVVVVGGGLTAIDTATESLAYYPVQVEKFLRALRDAGGRARQGRGPRAPGTRRRAAIADEFIAHARAIRAEREARRADGREPRMVELLQSWGGVTIAYRKRLIDSPSYTLNHEEVEKALEEGIRFAEGLTSGRGGGRRARPCQRSARFGSQRASADRHAGHGRQTRSARALDPGGGRDATQYRAGARRPAATSIWTESTSRPATRTASRSARARQRQADGSCACCCPSARTAASSAFSAICIRLSSATWSRPWAGPSRVIRLSAACSSRRAGVRMDRCGIRSAT